MTSSDVETSNISAVKVWLQKFLAEETLWFCMLSVMKGLGQGAQNKARLFEKRKKRLTPYVSW